VKSNQEITQGDIATRLAMASPTVHWYMQRFTTDGIVTAQRMGRLTHYSVTGEALQVLTNPAGIRNVYNLKLTLNDFFALRSCP
jgi:DNA-binding transcriptional regulator LsrR (DeoR family)